MMHPKMLRRILTVAKEKLTPDDRIGFAVYFDLLKEPMRKHRSTKNRPSKNYWCKRFRRICRKGGDGDIHFDVKISAGEN